MCTKGWDVQWRRSYEDLCQPLNLRNWTIKKIERRKLFTAV